MMLSEPLNFRRINYQVRVGRGEGWVSLVVIDCEVEDRIDYCLDEHQMLPVESQHSQELSDQEGSN